MPLLEPSKGRFVPLFAYAPPPEKPTSEEAGRALAHRRELDDAVAAARRDGAAAGAAEAEARKNKELAALRVEMDDTLACVVADSVRQLNRQASEDRERLDLAVRSIVAAIAGSEGRQLLFAGLATQILETVLALTAYRPLTVALGQEEYAFIAARVPEFESVMRKLQVRVLRRPDAPAAAAAICHGDGSVRIDLAGAADRLLEAVMHRASEAGYLLAEKEDER